MLLHCCYDICNDGHMRYAAAVVLMMVFLLSFFVLMVVVVFVVLLLPSWWLSCCVISQQAPTCTTQYPIPSPHPPFPPYPPPNQKITVGRSHPPTPQRMVSLQPRASTAIPVGKRRGCRHCEIGATGSRHTHGVGAAQVGHDAWGPPGLREQGGPCCVAYWGARRHYG